MTTKNSPIARLREQAWGINAQLRTASLNRLAIPEPMRAKSIKFVIAMDDKVLTIEMDWSVINESSDNALVEFIVKQMREEG